MGLNRTEILRLLRETGKFVSGQELCDRYQVSRQAVWKAIKVNADGTWTATGEEVPVVVPLLK